MLLHYRLWPSINSTAYKASFIFNHNISCFRLRSTIHVRAATTALNMADSQKPSYEAHSDIITSDYVQINNIIFATSDDIKASLKKANKKTEIWTLSERLNNIERINPIPKLTSSNWNYYYESVKRLIYLTETACTFLPTPPSTKAATMWSAWWTSKLRESVPHIKINANESPFCVLTTIVSQSQTMMHSNLLEIIERLWTFQPSNNMPISKFITEYEKRFNDFKQNNTITPEIKEQMKYLLLCSIQKLDRNIAIRCRNCSFEEIISECYQYKSTGKSPPNKNKSIKCNFCKNIGHLEDDCKKKRRAAKKENKIPNNKVLSVVDSSCNSSFQ